MAIRTIEVSALARVEGEGAFRVRLKDGKVERAELRICGICPVAYQMSAVQAIEDALGLRVPEPILRLRRLLYCGEWIESHVLHVVMLHAPDFLGYESAVAMAKDHRAAVERGLRLKKAGNELLRLLGGREIHPVN
ncbi:MAG: nickel-dependent hydrogenase large subunit, partial [bacterium]|nr:nickel-dependent hydrogenase large subunit [bacterium]